VSLEGPASSTSSLTCPVAGDVIRGWSGLLLEGTIVAFYGGVRTKSVFVSHVSKSRSYHERKASGTITLQTIPLTAQANWASLISKMSGRRVLTLDEDNSPHFTRLRRHWEHPFDLPPTFTMLSIGSHVPDSHFIPENGPMCWCSGRAGQSTWPAAPDLGAGVVP
jgi:hypothetical protein